MQTITVLDKQTLLAHFPAIDTLFRKCFDGQLAEDLWHWLYIANPHGQPVVSLCYEDEVLVAHYGMVPMPLCGADGGVNAYLSVTSMVAPSHRSFGLFATLGVNAYAKAKAAGVDFVMGFPNKLAIPGRKKRLNWIMPQADFVASVSKPALLEEAARGALFDANAVSADLQGEAARRWRFARPGARYIVGDGLAYKQFGDCVDLIYAAGPEVLHNLPDDKKINLLVPGNTSAFAESKIFDYQFGGIALNRPFDPSVIRRQMCLSDVF